MMPLFKRALGGISDPAGPGETFDLLPPQIREMHNVNGVLTARGFAAIKRDKGVLARLAAWLFRFPPEGENIPLTVTFTQKGDGEILRRDFGGNIFETFLSPGHREGYLLEKFGPLHFLLECPCSAAGIDMHIRKIRLWGFCPFPLWLGPRVAATERVAGGVYQFDVDVKMPLIGRVIWYKGTLTPV